MFADGVSLRGACHLENQDAFQCLPLEDGWLLALSDGLGSKRDSAAGARALCAGAARIAQEVPEAWETPVAFAEAVHRDWLARLGDLDPEECCATLLAVRVRGNRAWMVRLGDGFAALRADGRVHVLADLKDSRFANETDCVSGLLPLEALAWKTLDFQELQGAVLCSDGVELNETTPRRLGEFTEEFTESFSGLPAGRARARVRELLEDWPGSDDKTLIYLLRGEEAGE